MNEDMISELFISGPSVTDYWVPPKSKEDYLSQLETAIDKNEKIKAIIALVEISRFKRGLNRAHNEALCHELVSLLQRYGQNPDLTERVTGLLIREGGYCEKLGDYEWAIKFYESSLAFETEDEDLRYFRVNNLAFCLNYMKRFEEAESLLRRAIIISPKKYNAWKNLGVSLEHQGQFEESAECYLKAISLSRGEDRSIMHLKRLAGRCPALERIPAIKKFLSGLGSN